MLSIHQPLSPGPVSAYCTVVLSVIACVASIASPPGQYNHLQSKLIKFMDSHNE